MARSRKAGHQISATLHTVKEGTQKAQERHSLRKGAIPHLIQQPTFRRQDETGTHFAQNRKPFRRIQAGATGAGQGREAARPHKERERLALQTDVVVRFYRGEVLIGRAAPIGERRLSRITDRGKDAGVPAFRKRSKPRAGRKACRQRCARCRSPRCFEELPAERDLVL